MTEVRSVALIGARGIGIYGGVEGHVANLASGLSSNGINVVVAVRQSSSEDTKNSNDFALALCSAPSSLRWGMIVYLFRVVCFLSRSRPAITHVHGLASALIIPYLKVIGLCVVFTHHGPDFKRPNLGVLSAAVLRLGEVFASLSDSVIALTPKTAKRLRRFYGIEATVIPNGSPSLISDPTTQDRKRTRPPYFLAAGRLVPEKRHQDLISAFNTANLPGWRLLIAGSSEPESEHSRALCRQATQCPSVELIGHVSPNTLRDLMRNAAAFVHPSSYEEQPLVLIEAAAVGAPILAADIEAHRSFLKAITSYFPVGDVPGLAALLRNVAFNPPPRQPRTSTDDWELTTRLIVDIYRRALRRAASRRRL